MPPNPSVHMAPEDIKPFTMRTKLIRHAVTHLMKSASPTQTRKLSTNVPVVGRYKKRGRKRFTERRTKVLGSLEKKDMSTHLWACEILE